MKPQRRWMQSVLAESARPVPALPWQRGTRRMLTRQGTIQQHRTPGTPARN